MKIRTPGEKTKIACETCKQLRQASWNYGDFELKDGTIVDEVMMAFCDTCGTVGGVATQSSWRIREAKEQQQKRRTSATVTLPVQDLAAMKLYELGGDPRRGPELVTLAILRLLSSKSAMVSKFARRIEKLDPSVLDGPRKKMNLYLTTDQASVLDELTQTTRLKRSEVIRRALIATRDNPEVEAELRKSLGIRRLKSRPGRKARSG